MIRKKISKYYLYNLSIITIIAFSYLSCENVDEQVYRFNIVNNSDITLHFYRGDVSGGLVYPDTTIAENITPNTVPPNSIFRLGGFATPEEIFDRLPNDTLSIYFFHPDTLSIYNWNEIRNEYKVLKRYDISLEDFRLLNLEIPYPPTIEMENIRQFPEYE